MTELSEPFFKATLPMPPSATKSKDYIFSLKPLILKALRVIL